MLSEQKYASIGTKKHSGHLVWTPGLDGLSRIQKCLLPVFCRRCWEGKTRAQLCGHPSRPVHSVRKNHWSRCPSNSLVRRRCGYWRGSVQGTARQIRLANGHLGLFQQTQRQLQKTAIDRLFAIKPGPPQNSRNPVAASSHYLSPLSALS